MYFVGTADLNLKLCVYTTVLCMVKVTVLCRDSHDCAHTVPDNVH